MRGIKFNLPFQPYTDGEPFQKNIETCKDIGFWKNYIDFLAMNRYNCLSLWRIISICDEDIKRLKLLWILFDQVPTYYDVLNKSVFLSIFNTSRIHNYKELSKATNLINIILMYNKETPNKGHVWLFSSHPEIHVSEREYLHIYGDNISTLRNIFNDMYNSSDQCEVDLIKKLISQKSKNEVDLNRIYEIIDRVAAQSDFVFPPEEAENIKNVYANIYARKEDEVEEFLF
jgi:bacterioferritin (cytochrome b1)